MVLKPVRLLRSSCKDAEAGKFQSGTVLNAEKLKDNQPQFVKKYYYYYITKRVFYELSVNSTGSWTATNSLSFMKIPTLT